MNLGWKMHNPVVRFEVSEKRDRTSKGVLMHLKAENRVMPIWVPTKLMDLYQYREGERVVEEVQLPEWFARKVGLIE